MECFLAQAVARIHQECPPMGAKEAARLHRELNRAYTALELLVERIAAQNRWPPYYSRADLEFIRDTLVHWREKDVQTRMLVRRVIEDIAQWQRADGDLAILTG